MSNPTVYAVVKVTIEIPVRASESGEKLVDLHRVAKSEGEDILRHLLKDTGIKAVSPVEFSHALVK